MSEGEKTTTSWNRYTNHGLEKLIELEHRELMPIRRLHPALPSTRMRFIYLSRSSFLHDRYREARFMDSFMDLVDMTHIGHLFDSPWSGD